MKKIVIRLGWSILYFLLESLIFIWGLNLLWTIPGDWRNTYKLGLPLFFGILYLGARKYVRTQTAVFLAFFLVSLGWMLDFFFTGELAAWFSLNPKTLTGFALTMVISTVLVAVPVLIGWRMTGRAMGDIYLQRSKKMWGILVGLGGLLGLGGLGVLQAWSEGLALNVILAALPMALLFSLANGFREELVYRAVFLNGFQANIGTLAAITVTTVVFVLAHMDVSYTPANLLVFATVLVVIGIVGSWIMLKTGSLLGAVLFHAGADVLLLMGLLSSGQVMS